MTSIPLEFIEPCECAFFSVYIDENLNVKPCSFANSDDWTFNLRKSTFKEIWDEKFSKYRNIVNNDCKRMCNNRKFCRGKCLFFEEISLCYSNFLKESLNNDQHIMASAGN